MASSSLLATVPDRQTDRLKNRVRVKERFKAVWQETEDALLKQIKVINIDIAFKTISFSVFNIQYLAHIYKLVCICMYVNTYYRLVLILSCCYITFFDNVLPFSAMTPEHRDR